MLTTRLLHPQILAALAGAGHSSTVLIADANYPASTTRGPHAAVVHLNLLPGTVDSVTILDAIAGAVPLEEALVMAPLREGPYAMDGEPPVWSRYREVLTRWESPAALQPVERFAFYDAATSADTALVVVSADTALYANILVRIGVVQNARP